MVGERSGTPAATEAAYSVAADARAEASAARAQLDSHERQCAERYNGILTQIGEVKAQISRGIYLLLAGMAGIVAALLKASLHL
jgi:hypothetical protein